MGKLIRKEAIYIKLETTYNTEAAPAAGDAILVEEPSWAFEGLRRNERTPVKATLPPLKSVMGGTLIAVSGTVEVKGSGTAGTAPEIDALLQIGGFGATVTANTSVVYKPASDGHKSATIYYAEDGDLFKITGARLNAFSVQKETGGIAKISFTAVGHLQGHVTQAMATPVFDAVEPSALIGVPFNLAGTQPVISNFSLDAGLETATPPDMAAADGYGEIRITGRNVTGSFDPEAVGKGEIDFIADFLNNADKALTIGPIGATAGNRVTITMPKINTSELSQGDRDGLRVYEHSFEAREATADDELEISFT